MSGMVAVLGFFNSRSLAERQTSPCYGKEYKILVHSAHVTLHLNQPTLMYCFCLSFDSSGFVHEASRQGLYQILTADSARSCLPWALMTCSMSLLSHAK